MDNRRDSRRRNRNQPDWVGALADPLASVRALVWAATDAVKETFGGLRAAVLWLLIGGAIMTTMQASYDVWVDANPPRDAHLTTSIIIWPDGRHVLHLLYKPVHSRRCASETTHFLQTNESGTTGREALATYTSGVAPVDKDGNLIPEQFEFDIPLPIGLPPGTYWHQSSRTTSCAVLFGLLQRHPPPSWTSAVPFVVTP